MLALELSGWYHLRPFLDFWAVEVDNKLFDFRWDGEVGKEERPWWVDTSRWVVAWVVFARYILCVYCRAACYKVTTAIVLLVMYTT
jgi:hypothetical protein